MPLKKARVAHVRIVVNKDVISARAHQPLIGGWRVAVVVVVWHVFFGTISRVCAFPSRGYPDFPRDVHREGDHQDNKRVKRP